MKDLEDFQSSLEVVDDGILFENIGNICSIEFMGRFW